VSIPLTGQASIRIGDSDPFCVEPGQAAVWGDAEPADVHWTSDCVQLWLMVQQAKLEWELERLLGRSLGSPVRFELLMDLRSGMLAGWRDAVEVLTHEFGSTPGLASHPRTSRHLERLLVHGLLLCQPHNYSVALDEPAGFGTREAIAKAVELLEERSEEPWTTSRLAQEVHVSIRSLQEGFRRQTGSPPMTHLRDIRLSRVRARLQRAEPGKTTVQAEASRCGFVHLGRFAAAYRAAFGETPSSTLARPMPSD
jgi:AraC-like DNA-binding protein